MTRAIGPYEVHELLGEGATSLVYLADQTHPLQRTVALKVFKPVGGRNRPSAQFEKEGRVLTRMNHRNIARIHDVGKAEDGRAYIAMERISGSPITAYCDARGLSIPTRLELFDQVCGAIEHAHQKGVIHRDLKPENVLVSNEERGDSPLVKVIDFGIATTLENAEAEEEEPFPDTLLGTPAYVSPEQAGGGETDVDTRTDIYSLGVLLYELLIGFPPFAPLSLRGMTTVELRRLLRNVEPQKPSHRLRTNLSGDTTQVSTNRDTTTRALHRELRRELDWITMKALDKEPERRYGTVSELASDLRRYLSGAPILARPPSRWYQAKKFAARHRTSLLLFAGGCAVAAAGTVVSLSYTRKARRFTNAIEKDTALYNRRIREILRLSDLERLRSVEAEANSLWPPLPHLAPSLEAWLQRARDLTARQDHHRKALESLKADVASDSPSRDWEISTLEDLLEGLDRIADPDGGPISAIEERLGFARTIHQRSIKNYRQRWDQAILEIGNPSRSPAYSGLKIQPQIGLVPLGKDPISGLWEFGHLQTGKLPTRGPEGNLVFKEEHGLVLVLIPGGTFSMGIPAIPPDDPESALPADERARPAHSVHLEAFFLSKYEMTQSQWVRVADRNPSEISPGSAFGRLVRSHLLHPVEGVSWTLSTEILRRLDLVLPTEAQWEYAVRAGTTTPWWTGEDRDSLFGAANLADRSADRIGARFPARREFPGFRDGFPVHAPVGSLRANPFGLHETIGNVSEWCLDRVGSYEKPAAAETGERLVTDKENRSRIVRGGSFETGPSGGVSTFRSALTSDSRRYNLGLRPARRLDVGLSP